MARTPLACAFALAAPLAQAQPIDAAPDESPQRSIGVVVVTGEAPSSLPTRIPTTIESITAQELERTVNATDSEDALKYFPSLLVRKRYIGDYNHAVLSTRASGTGNSARSLVFADGILLSNLLGNGATFTPRWGLVTPEEIERVDVLYGPFSAAYSGNSVGAVVDYVTRMPTAVRGARAHRRVHADLRPLQHARHLQRLAGQRVARRSRGRLVVVGQPEPARQRGPAAGVRHPPGLHRRAPRWPPTCR